MSFIKEKLRENWILKITAILLAWILWLFIQGEKGTVTTVTAPVVVDLPSGMVISGGLPSNVQVVVRGANQNLSCYINLQGAKEGENILALTDENIRYPKGLGTEVLQVNPSQVVLMLERRVRKTVPITVPVEGQVAEGFEIYEKIADPGKVTIEGPRSRIEPVGEIPTEAIALNGQRQQANFRVRLNIKDGTVRSSITDSVWVVINIGPRRKLYVVKDVPVFPDEAPYVSSPNRVDVQVMAPEAMRGALVPDNFRLKIDEQALEGASSSIKVKPVAVPTESWNEVKVSGTTPSEVTVRRKEAGGSKR